MKPKKKIKSYKEVKMDRNHKLIDEIVETISLLPEPSEYVYLFSPGKEAGFRKVKILSFDKNRIIYLPPDEDKRIIQKINSFFVISDLEKFKRLWNKYMTRSRKGEITEYHGDYFKEKLRKRAKECLK